jgi:hypothetical protein
LSAPVDVQRLREEILAWMTPPAGDRGGRIAGRQIRRLVEALERPSGREDVFLSSVAEAVLARRLLESGCRLDVEHPTAAGRHADFRVRCDGTDFFVHVKRIASPSAAGEAAALPEALLPVTRIARPVSVTVRWAPSSGAADLDALREALEPFVRQASVGEELVARRDDGGWIGSARIAAPSAGTHAVLRTGADAEWESAIPRVQRLLRKAYVQFMPGAVNAVCIVSDGAGALDAVETALLGTVVERWDRFPPRGHRVAHGRADDGFWSRGQYEMSDLVAWMPLDAAAPARVWERAPGPLRDAERAAADVLRRALGAG